MQILAFLAKLSLTRLQVRVEKQHLNRSIRFVLVSLGIILLTSESWATPEGGGETPENPIDASSQEEFSSRQTAKQFLIKHKWEEAIPILHALLKREPASISLVVDLAMALTYTGHREEALQLVNEAVFRTKNSQRNLLIRKSRTLSRIFLTNRTFQIYQDGLNQMAGKKYRSAREKFEKAYAEEPDNVEVLIRWGQSLVLDNEPEIAVERMKVAKRLSPFEPEVRLWLGRAFHQSRSNKEALAELQVGHSELHGSELASVWFGEALFSTGQTKPSIRVLETDVKNFPFHVLSLMTLARFRSQGGHPDASSLWSARKELQLALSRLDPYLSNDVIRSKGDLGVDLRKSNDDLKAEIQKMLHQIQSKLGESAPQASRL